MYEFNLYSIPPFLTAVFLFILGLFVFLKNKKSGVGLSFFLLCLSSSVWQTGYTFVFLSTTEKTAIFWQKFMYFGVPFMAPAIYHFSISFLKLDKQRKLAFAFYLIGLAFAVINAKTDLLINGVYSYFWGFYKKAGPLYAYFLFFWTTVGSLGVYMLYRGYIKIDSPLERQRRKYMFTALAISLLGLFDFIPAYGIEIYPFGYIGVMACLSIIAYAIIKYRLMDIAVAITRTTIFAAVYTIVLGVPFIITKIGKDWLIQLLGTSWWFGPLILMAVLATAGPFAYVYLLRNAEAILLREQRNYQETLKQAAIGIARIRNSKKLLDFIAHIITRTVRISHSAIYLFESEFQQFMLKAGRTLKENQPISINKKNPLIVWLENQKECLEYEEIKRKSEDNPDSIFTKLEEQMRTLNAKVIVGSFLEDELLNILVLGDKLSKRPYTTEDLNNFSIFLTEAGLAIDNALRYENIEEQVKQRTKELIEVQKQLVQAEKLATVGTLAGGVAHEINNPLTAVLTNVQMLLAANQVDPQLDRESLELIEEATKRCRTIVKKLMFYARKPLESTQISELNLFDAVNNVVTFLKYQLEQENITIDVQAKKDSYFVKGNRNELEQVVTNLILNAKDAIQRIKKQGSIHIRLSKEVEHIMLEITDEGIGIPEEMLSRIFDPFFTTKDVGKGLGLGLSICHSIVEKHNGTITAQSELNKHSTFTIKLPNTKIRAKAKSKA